MKREKIIELVNEIFEDAFELDKSELLPDKLLFTDLGLDSLDIVDLIVGLQKKFKVNLRESEGLREIRTLGDVYDFFEKNEEELRKKAPSTDTTEN